MSRIISPFTATRRYVSIVDPETMISGIKHFRCSEISTGLSARTSSGALDSFAISRGMLVGAPKNMVFSVFTNRFAHNCFSGICYWAANEDGIYFTGYDPPNHWPKMYNWTDGNGSLGFLGSSPGA